MIVDVADWPELAEAGAVDVIVMSGVWKVKVAVAWTLSDPLVPVMVTENVPSCVEWQANVAMADEDRLTLAGAIGESRARWARRP